MLMNNLQVAISQNQELLTQLLSVKDQRTEEQKFYTYISLHFILLLDGIF